MNGEPLEILLVEDNADHAELVRRNFADSKVANRLVHLEDGGEALDYLFAREPYGDVRQYPRPHLVLLDLRLPRVDGFEVLKAVKEDPGLRAIPIVILTTSEAESDMARAYKYHANSYVVKPVDFASFNQMLRELGFYWLAWNRCPW